VEKSAFPTFPKNSMIFPGVKETIPHFGVENGVILGTVPHFDDFLGLTTNSERDRIET
jgi:hypothetical protein